MPFTFNPLSGQFDYFQSGTASGIGGTIAVNQVAYGTGINTIGGSANLTWDGSTLGVAYSGTPSAYITGLNFGMVASGANTTSAFEGIYSTVLHTGSNPTLAINAIDNTAGRGGTSSSPTVRAIYNFAQAYDSATVTNLIGEEIQVSKFNTASITNAYGLKINSIAGVATNNYAINYDSSFIVDSSGFLSLGKAATSTGKISFIGTTSGTVNLSVADAAGSWTLKLPTGTGSSGQFLQTDGSGNTSWASASVSGYLPLTGGTMTGTITSTLGTVTVSTPFLTASQTWNAGAVTFNGILLTITPTANASGSAAIRVDAAGTNGLANTAGVFFKGTRNGGSNDVITLHGTGSVAITDPGFSAYAFTATNNNLLRGDSAGFGLTSGGLQMASDRPIAWSSTANWYDTQDVFLRRDAANTLAQRNSTNAQTFRLYNTYTDASNNEHFNLSWATNILNFGTVKNGTGTARVSQWNYGGTTTAAISVPITSGDVTVGGAIKVTSATMIKTATSFTNGAAAQVATMNNGPAAGNPTKWIPIDDNGTTRYIPAW